ncbi:hypothetical protein CGLAMM_01165 [Acetobacteraceae bacterium EV16G]|uniref:Uncharacterized protein n=1 Tax=Sorlinia euscelidii TaxID=3081148 RepID=A0ABU7TYY3_9PROT
MINKDKIEQNARIRNLIADTALKQAQARTEALKVLVTIIAAGGAVITTIYNFFK